MTDCLACLYGSVMKHDPKNPKWDERDWLVVSKGHCGPAVYAALALSGYFPEEELTTLNKEGTRLPSHCDRLRTPGIDMTAGSLGQGVSAAAGIAWGFQYQKKPNTVFTILGDGEWATSVRNSRTSAGLLRRSMATTFPQSLPQSKRQRQSPKNPP